jgi:ABC-type dipeptide/oligopeptide/nickel transport system permease component
MFKYVLKRLALSVVVLLGVSVIIYFLVRLMPIDYLENKFSAQIAQGTITYEQLDDFKKRYGLYMPEAYLSFEMDGYEGSFQKDAKEKKYEEALDGLITYTEFYAGKYENDKNTVLELNKGGSLLIW